MILKCVVAEVIITNLPHHLNSYQFLSVPFLGYRIDVSWVLFMALVFLYCQFWLKICFGFELQEIVQILCPEIHILLSGSAFVKFEILHVCSAERGAF